MSNEYDKIIKENLNRLIIPLVRKTLGLDPVTAIDINPRLQYTLEREADFIKKIRLAGEEESILHLEFQSANDRRMLERMLLYFALLYKTFRLPVRQYVFYIGKAKPAMPTALQMPSVTYRYELINLQDFSYQTFLRTNSADEVVLAILGSFEKEEKGQVVEKIFDKLRSVINSPLEMQQRVRQLEVLATLRDLQDLVIKQEEKMAITYPIEKDIRFRQGLEKGMEEGIAKGMEEGEDKRSREIALELLRKGLDRQLISETTGISPEELQQLARQHGIN